MGSDYHVKYWRSCVSDYNGAQVLDALAIVVVIGMKVSAAPPSPSLTSTSR